MTNPDTKIQPGGSLINEPAPADAPSEGLDLDSDAPLPPACDLSGDGTCEACQ